MLKCFCFLTVRNLMKIFGLLANWGGRWLVKQRQVD